MLPSFWHGKGTEMLSHFPVRWIEELHGEDPLADEVSVWLSPRWTNPHCRGGVKNVGQEMESQRCHSYCPHHRVPLQGGMQGRMLPPPSAAPHQGCHFSTAVPSHPQLQILTYYFLYTAGKLQQMLMDCWGQRRLKASGRMKLEVQPSPQTGIHLLLQCKITAGLSLEKPASLKLELSEEARYLYFIVLRLLQRCTWFKCEHYLPIMDLSRVPQM